MFQICLMSPSYHKLLPYECYPSKYIPTSTLDALLNIWLSLFHNGRYKIDRKNNNIRSRVLPYNLVYKIIAEILFYSSVAQPRD